MGPIYSLTFGTIGSIHLHTASYFTRGEDCQTIFQLAKYKYDLQQENVRFVRSDERKGEHKSSEHA